MILNYDEPFKHYVIDNFLDESLAEQLSNEFIDYNSDEWYVYDNPLEVKKALNNWYFFPPATYNFFQNLNSQSFINTIQNISGTQNLIPDFGLHGSGWHIQGNGGKLNIHLDYSIHPKLNLQRKFNLIIYLTKDWNPEWGGNLEFWSHDLENNLPKEKIKTIDCVFNRAVLFDASQNSWHGFSDTINCPPDKYRKSIAMYYMIEPEEGANDRKRALYAPSENQKNDPKILDLISKRVNL
jgi:Rps23 Pro-64 3,4-dihydroxylase Tpa1-like proline 4-hydroxylase